MQDADLKFLYDQILESIVRLRALSVETSDDNNDDVSDDLDNVRELLVKRDLLVFAAAIRNFAEATNTVSTMKNISATLSELYLSSGWPFHRDLRAGRPSAPVQVNLHQAVSRILHAHSVDILSNQYAFLARIAPTTNEYARLVAEHHKSAEKNFEPVLFLSTKQEPINLLLLPRLIDMARSYLIEVLSRLEKGEIYLARWFRA